MFCFILQLPVFIQVEVSEATDHQHVHQNLRGPRFVSWDHPLELQDL